MSAEPKAEFDIAVLGAGPAGMAAAATAAGKGASVVILDEQARPGGQIYRNVEVASPKQQQVLGPEYQAGGALAADLRASGTRYLPGCSIWDVSATGQVLYSRDGCSSALRAKQLILATGATERPVPLPGWTLPGVMTAGAAQILLKSGGLAPRDAVLVGSGPLLYLLAAQLCAAGHAPKALVETQGMSDLMAATRTHLSGALKGWRYLLKGAGLLARLRRAGVRRYVGARDIRLEGRDQLSAIRFTSGGKAQQIETELALLHMGVVPNTQISRLLRLEHHFDATQQCFAPVLDDLGRSSITNVLVAGDGAGIGGAAVAALSGRIAALTALEQLGHLSAAERDHLALPWQKQRRCELQVRPFLDRLYPPSPEVLAPADDTLICRCEEVSAGQIRSFARLGCKGPNQAKAFGRAGMGPCQGRFCGLSVTGILAQETGQSPDETGALRIRAPLKPISLGELATAAAPENN